MFKLSQLNYVFYHFVVELVSIIIAFTIFFIGWNSREFTSVDNLLFISVAYLAVGVLDIIHMMSYKGMNILVHESSNIATQLWIVARYMESISLLIYLLYFKNNKKLNILYLVATYFFLVSFFLLDIFYFKFIVPTCFIDGIGLTDFKIISEYIIIVILFISIYILIKDNKIFNSDIRILLSVSLALTILSEVCFTLFKSPYGFSNYIGHIFKFLSFIVIYKALIEEVLKKPYNKLFHQYDYSHNKLIASASFFSTMVHDLKNPLATIRALGQLGMASSEEEKHTRYYKKIIKNVDQLSEMLNSVMSTFSHEELVQCNLGKIIREVVENIEPICRTHNIQLIYNFQKSIIVLLEKSLFKRAIQNLIHNAVKAMGNEGRLEILVKKKKGRAQVVIKDNGPGIPDSIKDSLFEAFTTTGGTGLGLYMVKYTISNVQKGEIWYETEPGKGTTFFIDLPIKPSTSYRLNLTKKQSAINQKIKLSYPE